MRRPAAVPVVTQGASSGNSAVPQAARRRSVVVLQREVDGCRFVCDHADVDQRSTSIPAHRTVRPRTVVDLVGSEFGQIRIPREQPTHIRQGQCLQRKRIFRARRATLKQYFQTLAQASVSSWRRRASPAGAPTARHARQHNEGAHGGNRVSPVKRARKR